MSCLIKNIPPNASVPTGNTGVGFPLSVSEAECMFAPDFYLIREESTPTNEIPLFSHHPRFIEVFEEDIA